MKFVKPQLARAWTRRRDEHIISMPGFAMEPKIDGHRCAVVRTSKGVLLLSRTGKPIQPIDWLQTWAQRQLKPGTYVDGELVAGSGDSSHNVHSLRAHNPEALSFIAFDILWSRGRDLRDKQWNRRRQYLVDLSPMAFPWPIDGKIEPSKFYIIDSRTWSEAMPSAGRDATRATWLKQGFEGVMFKDIFAPYKPNSRSAWIKWKWSMQTDVIVVSCNAKPSEWRVRPGHKGTDGIMYPEGRHTEPWLAGHVGLEYGYGPANAIPDLPLQKLENVNGVGICSVAGSLGVTGPWSELQHYVGQVARVKCWGAYDTGALRHPQPLEYRDFKLGSLVLPPKPTLETSNG